MALFQKKRFRGPLVRQIVRELDTEGTDINQRKRLAQVLEDNGKLDKVVNFVHGLAKKKGRLAELTGLAAQPVENGELGGPFLDAIFAFLRENWMDILAYIAKLFL